MGLRDTLKKKAENLENEITALYYCYKDKRVKSLPKILVLITLAYALSPIDLIPDFIPILGYLDDLLIVPALIMLCIRLIPPELLSENRHRAIIEPVRLGKNWIMGSLVVAIWIALITIIAIFITHLSAE